MFSHRNIIREPFWNAQLANFHGDLLAVAWFGHANGRQVLRNKKLKINTVKMG